jgi:hypothetical protein
VVVVQQVLVVGVGVNGLDVAFLDTELSSTTFRTGQMALVVQLAALKIFSFSISKLPCG